MNEKFNDSEPGFCPYCGTILPLLTLQGDIVCKSCQSTLDPSVYGEEEEHYVIYFNSNSRSKWTKTADDAAEGPTVERKCPKCFNNKMSYATIQLRSADEGQTVFFTCTKCKYKESENS